MTSSNQNGIIACLGWGSLIWDQGTLPVRGTWHTDGPLVRTEFLRRSGNGRITLVLHESVAPVRGLWAIMDTDDPEYARTALGERESIPDHRHADLIGLWQPGQSPPHRTISDLPAWAADRNIMAVVWTNLGPKFHTKNSSQRLPTAPEIIAYLSDLEGETLDQAERYVRKAPQQIDTRIRRQIETELGWTISVDG